MKVLVCLSGGLDSALVLHMMLEHEAVETILFDYGQPHRIELDYAVALASQYSIPCRTIHLDHMPLVNEVVFAGRNLVLAAHAISIAAADGFDAVAMGCNMSDWECFPDCRPSFWKAVNAASEAYGVHVLLPLLRMTKSEVVAEAKRRDIAVDKTWSCYSPRENEPCGACLACRTRIRAGA